MARSTSRGGFNDVGCRIADVGRALRAPIPRPISHIRHGFTLIELLVVISIIALLVSILLPTLRSARDAARSTACVSGMRQIGMGFLMYAHDHDGRYPIADVNLDRLGSDWDNWAFLISGYLNDNREIYRCSMFDGPLSLERTYMTNGTQDDGDYGGTAYATRGGYGIHTLRDTDVARPSQTTALIEVWPTFGGSLPLYKPDTDIWHQLSDSAIPLNHPSFIKAPHANTTTHLFHPDGHAGTAEYEPNGTLNERYFLLTR